MNLYQLAIESIFLKTLKYIANKVFCKYGEINHKVRTEEILRKELLSNNQFYKDIKTLRNYYSHIRKSEKDETKFKECYRRRNIKELKSDKHYFLFQYKFLEDFKNYLTDLDENIKIKL